MTAAGGRDGAGEPSVDDGIGTPPPGAARGRPSPGSVPPIAPLTELDRGIIAAHLERATFEEGDVIVREGAPDRAMYVVAAGEARIERRGIDLGVLGPGEHFGELGLLAGRVRAASIVAASRLEVLVLTHERFQQLSNSDPTAALHLVQGLVAGVADRLVDMTESVGLLLRERSLPRRTSIDVHVLGQLQRVRVGTPVGTLLPREHRGRAVVAALVDQRPTSLSAPLSCDCDVTVLTTASGEGERIHRQSLALLLLEAAHRHDPKLALRLEHSVGFGQRVAVAGVAPEALPALGQALQARMLELVAEDASLREEFWTVQEALAHFEAQGWTDLAALLETWRAATVALVSYGEVYALALGPTVPSTGCFGGFSVLPDEGDLLLVHGLDAPSTAPAADVLAGASLRPATLVPEADRIEQARAASRHARTMTRDQARWLDALGITSVGAFNRASIRGGDVSQLIRVSEGFHEKRTGRIADEIAAREGTKVVCVAGPSSSGKTTFIKRLRVQLLVNGRRPVGLSLDDYYVDRDRTPRDERGELDFEAVDALELDLLADHLRRLLAGERVTTAHYDFATGASHPAGGPEIQLGDRDLLLIEGIHGLNPRLHAGVGDDRLHRIFVCPLAQLPFDRRTRVHASDVRLLRRIVRDRHGRAIDAASNILRWPSVRAGERKHIFPYQHHADAVFDSSLIYELSVLKVYAERYLLEVPQSHPAYPTAFRLLSLVDRFVAIYPDHVPPTSLLREFIGGSGFEY